MKLYEYLAKQHLAAMGVPTPAGDVATTPEEAEAIARKLGKRVAIKAQVLVGGRGKAGGIKLADTPAEARQRASEILGMNLKGHIVEKVWVEEALSIDRELYLSVTVNAQDKCPMVMASAHGGVNIEEVAEEHIAIMNIDVNTGLMPYHGREIARRIGLTGDLAKQFQRILVNVYNAFRKYDAELVEINPLAVVGEQIIAADSRLNVEDDALFRHQDLPEIHEGTELELKVKETGLAFVQLEGDIAIMANGAGMAMGTLDVLSLYGGRPANFLDAGGGASVEPTAQAIGFLMETNPKAIFINIFGGITRCDDVAKAIIQVKEGRGIPVPLVVRMAGTNDEEGRQLLNAAGIHAFTEMGEAARAAVAAAYGKGA